MPELKRLHAGRAAAILAFELANRSYFAASVSDRRICSSGAVASPVVAAGAGDGTPEGV